jgi:putative ABC transport system permease protein
MLNNLIKYSLRSFRKQRSSIIINILGLSIGIACSLLIAFFVMHETSYDSYNTKKARIFNMVLNFKMGGQEFTDASSPASAGPAILNEFPEVEDFLRMMKMGWIKSINYKNEDYYLDNILEADSSFFNFFSIPVIKGDRRNLLNAPMKAVISESTARKIFGTEDPLDKTLKLGRDTALYTITGVMSDIPGNSHFNADILISFMSDPQANSPQWTNNRMSTYLLLKPNSDYKSVAEKFPAMVIKYIGPEIQRILNIPFDEFLSSHILKLPVTQNS